jgi:serine/threonine protein kinase
MVATQAKIGRYQVLRSLGRGAMGVVYLAEDPLIERQVALKTLRVDVDAEVSKEFRERFFREARAAGRLSHPGIVMVHDVGEDAATGVVFIAMELVHGRNLKQLLKQGHTLRPSQAARLAAEVATALEYAHRMGVVHRDIKPANLLVTDDGSVKITDFGVARLESSNLTVDGQFLGTPNYMSPEQVTGQAVDGRSDLFSLGVVLFELLTGRRPFTGSTLHEVTTQIVQAPTPIPSSLSPKLPPSLNPIVLKCLEKERERRFASCADLAAVLSALARSLVERDPDDHEQTGVFAPDLGTRISHQGDTGLETSQAPRASEHEDASGPGLEPVPPALPEEPEELVEPLEAEPTVPSAGVGDATHLSPAPAPDAGSQRWAALRRLGGERLEMLHWPVHGRWVIAIVGASVTALAITLTLLASALDPGPFTGPSRGSLRAQHAAVQALSEATEALRAGDPVRAESLALAVLDHEPTSPAARGLVRAARTELERQANEASAKARVSELVAEGRRLYRRGQYAAAAELFAEAAELDPEHEIAASFLELARERARGPSTASRRRPTPVRPARSPTPEAVPRATPATAQLLLSFDSPLSEGSVVIQAGAAPSTTVDFNFTRRGVLGLRRSGTGQVRESLTVPSGRSSVTVTLRNGAGSVLGSETFERVIPGGSRWTMRIDLAGRSATPLFYMVPID